MRLPHEYHVIGQLVRRSSEKRIICLCCPNKSSQRAPLFWTINVLLNKLEGKYECFVFHTHSSYLIQKHQVAYTLYVVLNKTNMRYKVKPMWFLNSIRRYEDQPETHCWIHQYQIYLKSKETHIFHYLFNNWSHNKRLAWIIFICLIYFAPLIHRYTVTSQYGNLPFWVMSL